MKLKKTLSRVFKRNTPGFAWEYLAESETDTVLLLRLYDACLDRFPMGGNVVPMRVNGVGNLLPIFQHTKPSPAAVLVIHSSQSPAHNSFFINFLIDSRALIVPDANRSDTFIPQVAEFPVSVGAPPLGDIPGFTDETKRGNIGSIG